MFASPKSIVFLTLLIAMLQVRSQAVDYPKAVKLYIDKYKDVAVNEMAIYRIPASITLAQGIHESRAGLSELATQANNHFGIKCHKDWLGKTYHVDDDAPDECFRRYDSPMESFRDHSYFLTQRDRYKGLFELDVTDYKGWAHGLKAAGYATNPKYAEILIRTIEEYQLYQFDIGYMPPALASGIGQPDAYEAWMSRFQVVASGPGDRKVFVNNDLRLTVVKNNDNLHLISQDFDISISRLMKYNDLLYAGQAAPGNLVYLEPKRRKGAMSLHMVKPGENMHSVSQLYGIRLKMLYRWNGMEEGSEPFEGQILRLR